MCWQRVMLKSSDKHLRITRLRTASTNTWTVGHPEDAMTARTISYLRTLQDPVLTILSSSFTSSSLARQTHAHILKSGQFNSTSLSNKLLSLYANHECFTDATLLLDSIREPDIYSFSTIINALSKFNLSADVLHTLSKMHSKGLCPDSYILPTAIKACTALSALEPGQQVHGLVCKYGCSIDVVVQSSLLHMYVKIDKLTDAGKLFDEIPQPDVVTLSALIAGYARDGNVDEAKRLFYGMGDYWGLEPNLVSWNGMIAGFNQSGQYSEAVRMFGQMYFQGFKPDGSSVSSVLASLGDLRNLSLGVQVHDYVIKLGLLVDKWVVSAMIDMYGKCARVSEMKRVFDEMEHMELGSCNALISGLARNGLVDDALTVFNQIRDREVELSVVSWTSMIACCSQNGKDIEALDLFREMQLAGVRPNAVTIPCLLPACGNIAALIHGKAAHCFSLRRMIIHDVYVSSALVDMYSKCGKIKEAQACFNAMPTKNVVSWNAIIGGYAMHGKSKEAIEIFELMKKSGQKPDVVTFTCVLSACSQKGMTDEGWYYFNSMSEEHGIKPKLEHYACMVSLLSRAGKLEEAYDLVKTRMPYEPDGCVWGALLSSCRVHKNVTLAEIAAEKLFELEPRNPGNYVLMSNIYASKGMWKDVDRIRDLMNSNGLEKNPGCSWIEVNNRVHTLLADDNSHPMMNDIMEKLEELNAEMHKSGVIPRTDNVLHDVEEQDKEHILCGHSEKLAVAFGLLNTPAGTTLRIIKNLRICGDCHVVMKCISSFERREILVRDTNRFHQFKNGECSCGDYW